MRGIIRKSKTIAIAITIVLLAILPLTATELVTYHKTGEIVKAEAQYDLFSGTILVAQNGIVLYAKGFGEANKEYDIPNILDTKFNISSVQKTFIATVIMQLYQTGKIDLDDPLTKYYPDCPWDNADQIIIRYLLNHTSGLGDYRESEEYQRNAEKFRCIDDVLPLVWKYEPAFAPGERFRYSNAGVLLLKGIIEKTMGKKLKDVLRELILHPLGMNNTAMYVGGDVLKNRASAYTLGSDGESYKRVTGEPSAYSGGGIYTTVLDLLKFDQALYGESLLSEANKKIMFTPVEASPNYAYGWIVSELEGNPVIWHSGGSGGFNSEFRRYPEKGFTIIVLSNYQGAATELADKVERMLFDLPYSLASEADLNFKRGMHLQGHGLYNRALESFEKNISGESPHMASIYQAARTRIIGEFDQQTAIDLLDRYISLADELTRPSAAAAWWRRGIAYEQLGDIENAISSHKKCLELDSSWTEATEAIERLQKDK